MADDKTTAWLRSKFHTSRVEQDALALVQACATLAGSGSIAFGMVVPADLPSRASLIAEGLDVLRTMIPTLPDDQCDVVFGVIDRANLLIDVSARRAKLEAKRREAAAGATTWLLDQIASSNDVGALVSASATMFGRGSLAFGMVVTQGVDRARIGEAGLAKLRALIPAMSPRELDEIARVVRTTGLPLDVTDQRRLVADARHAARVAERQAALANEPRNPALEAELAADLANHEALLVYADWLQGQGHPRGELITLMLEGEDWPAHLDAHASVLLGGLAPHRLRHDSSGDDALVWHAGFITEAYLSVVDGETDSSLGEILETLLVHPSARYLRELSIGMNGESSDAPLDTVIGILAREAPATLRVLHIGDFEYPDETEMSWYQVGDLGPIWPRLGALDKLIVQGGMFELGTLDLPNLTHAEFRTGGLSASCVDAITTARWPRLRHLDVWFGDPNYGGDATLDQVRALLARGDLTALEHLGLMNAPFTDEICGLLVASPLVGRLRELDLSMGTLSTAGAQILLDNFALFAHLERLDVSRNYLDDDAIAQLEAAFPAAITGEQQIADPDDRYPSIGE